MCKKDLNLFEMFQGVCSGAGKSAVPNSLIGHPALPTGEGGATRINMCWFNEGSFFKQQIHCQLIINLPVSASALWHSLCDRLRKISGRSHDEIYLKLRTSTAPPLKLIDLPALDDSVGGGWKVVASFEDNFPSRIKQLPLDRHF